MEAIGMAGRGNFISEWYGYRVFPAVRESKSALQD